MLNPEYLEVTDQIIDTYQNEGSVILLETFTPAFYKYLKDQISTREFTQNTEFCKHHYQTAPLPGFLQREIQTSLDPLNINITNATIFKLQWKDFSVLHDETKEDLQPQLIIDFTDHWREAGGTIHFKDEEINLPIHGNMIALIKNTKHRFFKYVNHKSNDHHRLFLIANLE